MPTIREDYEKREAVLLSEYAFRSADTKGRQVPEDKCDLRTEFSRDRDRIIHSKSFRRLKHKTQVFILADNDHFRTRLTHTLEVSQIARTICRALGLNEDLAEAISMGHDLGHTPFGHSGERALNALNPKGFRHYEQSLRVADILEKDGRGMNLTYEVRDGILNHSGANVASTLEGAVIKYADRFAYINHDIDDALRAGVIRREDLPSELVDAIGQTHSRRIGFLIKDIVSMSAGKNAIAMSPQAERDMLALRQFMFTEVYEKLAVKDFQPYMVIEKIYKYFLENPSKLPPEFEMLLGDWDIHTVVCDYISCMTDNYCIRVFNDLFMPSPKF